MHTIRPTRLEIDLDAICSNYRALRAAAGGSPALAVVKADAYGHGAVPVARALRAAGADMFVEVGFGGVLANLVKRIDKTATRACVQDRASFDGCLAVASATDSE